MKKIFLILSFTLIASLLLAQNSDKIKTFEYDITGFSLSEIPQALTEESTGFEFYGDIKVDFAYNTSHSVFDNSSFYTVQETSERDNEFTFTVNQSMFGVKFGSFVKEGIEMLGLIEVDFYGSNDYYSPTPELYRAFMTVRFPKLVILAGQDYDTHSRLNPTRVNYSLLYGSGNVNYRRPQIRLVKLFGCEVQKLTLAIAAAQTVTGDLDGNGFYDGTDVGWPTAQARIAYEYKVFEDNKPLTLALSGHFGTEELDWDLAGADEKHHTYSAVGEFVLPFGSHLYLQGEGFYGSNLDSYYGGILQGINTTTQSNIVSYGGWAELGLKPFEKVAIHIGGGIDNPIDSDLSSGDRRINFTIYDNIYYSFTENFILAGEHFYNYTDYHLGVEGDNNRFQGSMIYKF
ncbi:MAG: hypothetical protein ABIA04_10880 [Pseudomonadota bacterium]